MNRFPLWKNLLLGFILFLGVLYALPNLFGEDPAVQVSPLTGFELNDATHTLIQQSLDSESIRFKAIELENEQSYLVRFFDTTDQIRGQEAIKSLLNEKAIVALNLSPKTPKWLQAIGANPMKLGLDLRGGVHFLLEVDLDSTYERRLETVVADIKTDLRERKIRWQGFQVKNKERAFVMSFADKTSAEEALKAVRHAQHGLDMSLSSTADGYQISAVLGAPMLQEIANYTVEQTISTLRNRVNELGVAESVVQRQGLHHVVVELPGIQDTARAKDILGKTATLEFHLVDTEHDIRNASQSSVPPGSKIYLDRQERPHLLKKRVLLTGDSITGAYVGTDNQNMPAVSIRVGGGGLALFTKSTRENVGKPMATVYIESKVENEVIGGETVKRLKVKESVINVATIRSALGRDFQITGVGIKEAQDLSLLLRSGALPAAISIVEERTVGPSLGKENIRMGVISIEVGMGLVLLTMLLYYSVFGIIANLALIINVVLLIAILSLIGATLTFPGIAGIVLTVGMAVDANVLIFERIREEMRLGMTSQAAIHAGFERAFATILDSNLTTLIVAIILFSIGTGPIKGFAITLTLGIMTSMLTAISGTRAMVNLAFGGRVISKLPVGI